MKNPPNSFKVALLIQGPLKSIGRSGKTSSVDLHKIQSSDVIAYDCRKLISELVNKYGYLFEQIILSTWNDEILEFEENSIEIYKFNKDKVPKGDKSRAWINNPYVSKNNTFYQYYGCIFGLKKIRNDINHVVKIRTDQFINLEKIFNFMQKNYEKDTVLVPKISLTKGPVFEDFYFAGSKKIINKFLDSIISKDKEGILLYSDSPHINPLLKFAFAESKKTIFFEEKYYKKFGYGSLEQYVILFYIFNKYFRPFPFEIAKNMKWRGSKFGLNNIWIKDQNDKLNFDFKQYYKKDIWSTHKKFKPRLKNFLKNILSLIKNVF